MLTATGIFADRTWRPLMVKGPGPAKDRSDLRYTPVCILSEPYHRQWRQLRLCIYVRTRHLLGHVAVVPMVVSFLKVTVTRRKLERKKKVVNPVEVGNSGCPIVQW